MPTPTAPKPLLVALTCSAVANAVLGRVVWSLPSMSVSRVTNASVPKLKTSEPGVQNVGTQLACTVPVPLGVGPRLTVKV